MRIDSSIHFVFIGGGLFAFIGFRNAIRGMITEIGRNPKFFPKKYIAVPKLLKRIYNIRQQFVPRFLYYECYISIGFLILSPIEMVLYYCREDDGLLASWMLFAHIWCFIINMIVFLIMSAIYKKE